MPENFRDYVDPVSRITPIDRLEHEQAGPPPRPAPPGLHGRVIGVRRGQQHKDGAHRLDVTVGGDDTTELIVRVPNGTYSHWDGKKVLLLLDE